MTNVFLALYSTIDDACQLCYAFPVVHLTERCLNMSMNTHVTSFPIRDHETSKPSVFHIQFGYDDTSEVPAVVAVAEKMKWTSAAYVGNTHEGKI